MINLESHYETVAGIDPGKHGGITVIDKNDKVIYCKDLSTNNEIMISRLRDISNLTETLFLESAISVQTNRNVCNRLFFINGYLTGVAESLGLKVIGCNPGHWKKIMKLTSDKSLSISVALKLFDNFEEVMYSRGSTKDGIAESALIAYYGMHYNKYFPETEQLPKKTKEKSKQMEFI